MTSTSSTTIVIDQIGAAFAADRCAMALKKTEKSATRDCPADAPVHREGRHELDDPPDQEEPAPGVQAREKHVVCDIR